MRKRDRKRERENERAIRRIEKEHGTGQSERLNTSGIRLKGVKSQKRCTSSMAIHQFNIVKKVRMEKLPILGDSQAQTQQKKGEKKIQYKYIFVRICNCYNKLVCVINNVLTTTSTKMCI